MFVDEILGAPVAVIVYVPPVTEHAALVLLRIAIVPVVAPKPVKLLLVCQLAPPSLLYSYGNMPPAPVIVNPPLFDTQLVTSDFTNVGTLGTLGVVITIPVIVDVHAGPEPFLIKPVYVPEDNPENIPVVLLVLKLSVLNKYGVTPPVPDKVILPLVNPQLLICVLVGAFAVGEEFTVIVNILVALQLPRNPVKVTCVVEPGLNVFVTALGVDPELHVYVVAPEAVRVVDEPLHNDCVPVKDTIGAETTEIVNVLVKTQPDVVPETVNVPAELYNFVFVVPPFDQA